MTDLTGPEHSLQGSAETLWPAFASGSSAILKLLAWVAGDVIRTLARITETLGRALQMAYVDPFTERDRDRL